MRFNHMELTFPIGSLTREFREEIDAFYASIFGWTALDTEVVGQSCHLLLPDPEQFILLAESNKPMSSPGYDHLGLLQARARKSMTCWLRASATPTRTIESRLCATTISSTRIDGSRLLRQVPVADLLRRAKHWSGRSPRTDRPFAHTVSKTVVGVRRRRARPQDLPPSYTSVKRPPSAASAPALPPPRPRSTKAMTDGEHGSGDRTGHVDPVPGEGGRDEVGPEGAGRVHGGPEIGLPHRPARAM